MARCHVDFNIHDRIGSIRAFIERLESASASAQELGLTIDLTRCTYLGPDATAILVAVYLAEQQVGRSVVLCPPMGPPALRAYWQHSGLASLKDEVKPAALAGSTTEPVIPWRQFKVAAFTDADPVIQLIRRHTEITDEAEEYLRICVNEVIQNTEDHADSPVGAILSARYLTTHREVRVAIVDRGEGVATTLGRRYGSMSADRALALVTSGNYSAQSRPNNMGLGLSNLANIVHHLQGSMFIISEGATAARTARGSWKLAALPCRFAGTGVFFSLPMAG